MLYEIDESCKAVLKTKDYNIIAFFEQLALDRRKCRNIVVAKREIFCELANTEYLSELARAVYKVLGNRMSERKLLLKNTKKYCRIVAMNCEKNRVVEEDHEIILLNIKDGSQKDFTSYPLMLAENEEDIEFYKFIGQYFVKKNRLGNMHINFEGRHGGGSTISKVLEHIISERNRMCLCIVDSDRKYEEASCGETMQGIVNITQDVFQDYFEVLLLEVHEIENIIPLGVLEHIVITNNLEKQGLLFLKYLIECDNTLNSPFFYFDLKKGILKKSFILEDGADDQCKKNYRKKELYRKYWQKYIEDYGIKIDSDSNTILVNGISVRILRDALELLRDMKRDDKLDLLEVDEPIRQVWDMIGEKVYCWGCIGGRIAV